ncbi:SMP-30/gluconolactonase/LRE family protein [Xenorhabdus sp. 42]|uniref:SMP-30/gluconolactonase/LRE family protein n=1 Tax=Xenorhabdus szentirmaii TaxID=290112 RepID=UPI000C045EF9|nr:MULTISPECIES: SMP-30/gluconolactonase/LRE family protein [Xenorhabdus]MBD2820114.1 SMP-30/gluconolactonase/LRE family protein [Xenorhabdus sp. 42]PHM44247.1 gluconolactonase [Xenorhabdus szentirmaii]
MNVQMEATLAIDARNIIGEGPLWDAGEARLLWCDNALGIVREAQSDNGKDWHTGRHWTLNRHIGGAVPRQNGGVIVVAGTDILALDDDGYITPFAQLDADPKKVRANDVKCDAQGRLWVGTLGNDILTSSGEVIEGQGSLYRIDPDGTMTTILNDITLSNGLDWSPDGTSFYYVDSHTLAVDIFDFDASEGTLHNRRCFKAFAKGEGIPNGLVVDQEGCIWLALMGSGAVHRYSPAGELMGKVLISTPAVTSCTFGGIHGDNLFITSAGRKLPDITHHLYGLSLDIVEQSATAPGAGGLFICQPGVSGPAATPFAG